MKKLILALILAALILPTMAYDPDELDSFASGVMAAKGHGANWAASGDTLVVSMETDWYNLIDVDSTVNRATDMEDIARTIADHYPGEFNATVGIMLLNGTPLVVVTKYYRPDAPEPIYS